MKILFIGESWHIHMIHSKGYDSFTSSKYEEGATWLLGCLRSRGIDVHYLPAHEVQIAFPSDINVLSEFDVVVISDIGSNTFLLQNETFYHMQLKANALHMMKDFVAQGGGLLMIGGYLSFMGIEAKANYKNTLLAEVLPVLMQEGDDRVEVPEGIQPSVVNVLHPTICSFTEWPVFLGYNKVCAKDDAQTVLTIANDPLLVYGTYQSGKTACFMSDCSPHWGSNQFMHWPYYTDMWVNILSYISRT